MRDFEVTERAQSVIEIEEDIDAEATYRLAMEVFGKDGWNDPAMDTYNELDPRRQS